MDSAEKERILESLGTVGYAVVPNLIPGALREPLRAAAERVAARARDETSSGWPHVRVVGKQFPPWPEGARQDVWGVQHVMHPDLDEPAFAQWYASEPLLDAVKTILGCDEDELQMELFNLLVNPARTPFSLEWHRDAVPPETPAEKELEMISTPRFGTQWNTALLDDCCLLVVPGSHRRVRTDEERAITLHNPRGSIAGELVVKLKPGDTVFYDNNILHRAAYPTAPARLTLHACMGTTKAGFDRARNILQHNMDWVRELKFDGKLENMRRNLIRMRDGVGDDIGYSLRG